PLGGRVLKQPRPQEEQAEEDGEIGRGEEHGQPSLVGGPGGSTPRAKRADQGAAFPRRKPFAEGEALTIENGGPGGSRVGRNGQPRTKRLRRPRWGSIPHGFADRRVDATLDLGRGGGRDRAHARDGCCPAPCPARP